MSRVWICSNGHEHPNRNQLTRVGDKWTCDLCPAVSDQITKTFPKLVMKEWPESELIGEIKALANHLRGDGRPYSADVADRAVKALSNFTRVVEGVQKDTPLTRRDRE